MKKILILLLLVWVKVGAQNKTNTFNNLITEVRGDLNKDGVSDLVRVTQDTVADTRHYRLQVFFMQSNNNQQLIVTTSK